MCCWDCLVREVRGIPPETVKPSGIIRAAFIQNFHSTPAITVAFGIGNP